MANLKEVIKEERAAWEKTQKMIEVIELLQEHPDHKLAVDYVLSIDYLRVTIEKLSHLTKMRKILRESFGRWSDKMRNQFISCGSFITTWKGNGVPIEIWYFCSPNNIDPELQKPNCRVIETAKIEQCYVCNLVEVE